MTEAETKQSKLDRTVWEFCELKRLNPFGCGQFNLGVESAKLPNIEELIIQGSHCTTVHTIVAPTGEPLGRRILEYALPSDYSKLQKANGKFEFKIADVKHVVNPISFPTKVTEAKEDDKGLHKYTRRIKTFTGRDKHGGGEAGIHEWRMLAQDAIDNDAHLTPLAQRQLIRTSLQGDPLKLVQGMEDPTAQKMIDIVSRAYGGTSSVEQTWTDFYRAMQRDKEKPSHYWARLEEYLLDIKRISSDLTIKYDSFRAKQFIHGLCPDDVELICQRTNLRDVVEEKLGVQFPTFNSFLERLQLMERERFERKERFGNVRVRSALVHTDDNMEQLQLQVASLQTQLSEYAVKINAVNQQYENAAALAQAPLPQQNQYVNTNAANVPGSGGGFKPKPQFRGKCFNCEKQGHESRDCKVMPYDRERVMKNYQEYKKKRNEFYAKKLAKGPQVGEFEQEN